jgi:type I restriction enzyme S subunit
MSGDGEWSLIRISDILKESRIQGSRGSTARKITVKLYGKGVVPGRAFGGSENTLYFRRSAGQFIYSKLDFLNGAFGIIPESLDGFESTADLPAFDFKADIEKSWLIDTVVRPEFYKRFKYSAIGSRKANRVPVDEFLATRLSLPPRPEQLAIADVLQSVENYICRTRDLLKSLADAKFAVMHDLLTRGMRRDAVPLQPLPERWVLGRVAGDVTDIPVDWKLVRLTSVAKLESGHTPDRKQPHYWDGDIPWISLQDADALGKRTISETAETIGAEGLKKSSARMLPARTVVFQRTANVGLCSIMEREMCTSQHFANWVCGPELLPEYLQQVFRHMQREWLRLVAGSVLPDIYMPTFKHLQIFLPPVKEQERIAETGALFDLRIELEGDALARLQEVRAALAQELLSGRVRLPASMVARFANEQAQPMAASV